MQEEHVQYLVLAFRHLERIELPDVGLFIRQRIPARFDDQLQVLHPPSEYFVLEPVASGSTFRDFLSQRFHLEAAEAETVILQIASRLQSNLRTEKRMELAGFGHLVLDTAGAICWEPTFTEQQQIRVPVPVAASSRNAAAAIEPLDLQQPIPPALPDAPSNVPAADSASSVEVPPPVKLASGHPIQPPVAPNRSPVEQAALVLITALLLGILVSLFVFRKAITNALGINGSQSVELAESDAEIESELLNGSEFVPVDAFGRQGLGGGATWTAEPGTLVYHIIVCSEVGEQRASSRLNEWQAKGYRAVLVPGVKKSSWRISIYQTTKLNECDRKLAELKLHSLVPYDTWTLKVQY